MMTKTIFVLLTKFIIIHYVYNKQDSKKAPTNFGRIFLFCVYFAYSISDNMAIDSDGDLLIRMGDNMAMDMDSGELHIISGWSNEEDDD